MAKRAYKANRSRGTRQEHYKETIVSGYIIPRMPKKGGKDAYLKAFIKANEEMLQSSYDSAVNQFRNIGEEARFKEQNPDIATYVKRYFGKGRLSKKLLIHAVNIKFADISEAQQRNIYRMLEDTGFLDLLSKKADEKISVTRISYSGDNVYVYRTATGKVIRFNFTGYSPAEIHFMDEDDVE